MIAIGTGAKAFGYNTNVVSIGADGLLMAPMWLLGPASRAVGVNGLAFGSDAKAEGTNVTAMGPSAWATGTASTAIGPKAFAFGVQAGRGCLFQR